MNLCVLKRKVVQGGSTHMTYLKNNHMITAYHKRAVLVTDDLYSAFPFVGLRCKQQISDVCTIYALATATTLL